jgi:hypothetical protein
MLGTSLLERLASIEAPLLLLAANGNMKSKHLFECKLCHQTFERQFEKVFLRKQFCCYTPSCPNSLSVVAVKPITTEVQAIQAFAKFGSIILSEYKGAKHKVTALFKCGVEFTIRPNDVIHEKQTAKCHSCGIEGLPRGENHPAWTPNKPVKLEMRRGFEKSNGFYNRVKQFHGNYCFITAEELRPNQLSAHHMDNAADHMESAHDPNIGACISRVYHTQFHKLYGFGANTVEQFSEFFHSMTGELFEKYYAMDKRQWILSSLAERYSA